MGYHTYSDPEYRFSYRAWIIRPILGFLVYTSAWSISIARGWTFCGYTFVPEPFHARWSARLPFEWRLCPPFVPMLTWDQSKYGASSYHLVFRLALFAPLFVHACPFYKRRPTPIGSVLSVAAHLAWAIELSPLIQSCPIFRLWLPHTAFG